MAALEPRPLTKVVAPALAATDWFDAAALRDMLAPGPAARIDTVEVFEEIGSTNAHLLTGRAPPPGRIGICLARHQHAGRGRRGRQWHAEGRSLCLSAIWCFAKRPSELAALGLATGVAVRRALERSCGIPIALKWPNDLVVADRKLGGILLETANERNGAHRVVAGVGINIAVPAESLARLCDWPSGAIDLATAIGGAPPDCIAIAAAIVEELAGLFARFAADGFAPYREEWLAADCLRGRRIAVHDARGSIDGTACGIDGCGALLVALDSGIETIVAGDVSVRSRT